jgi:hypothetical protein
MTRVVTPVFLTTEVADIAIEHVVRTFFAQAKKKYVTGEEMRKHMPFGENCYVAVYVPAFPVRKDGKADYTRPYKWHFLFGKGFGLGDPSKFGQIWEHDFEDIARCKAVKGDRSDQPHLLYPGETVYWGNVEVQGIRIGCSGFASEDDMTVSENTGREIIRLAKEAFDTFMQTFEGDFLPAGG